MLCSSCVEFSIVFNMLSFLLAPQINNCTSSSLQCFQGVFNLFYSSLYHMRSPFNASPFLLRCLFLFFVLEIMQQLHSGYSGRPTHIMTKIHKVFLIRSVCGSRTCSCVPCFDILLSNRSSNISYFFTFCTANLLILRQALSILLVVVVLVIIIIVVIVIVIVLIVLVDGPVPGFIFFSLTQICQLVFELDFRHALKWSLTSNDCNSSCDSSRDIAPGPLCRVLFLFPSCSEGTLTQHIFQHIIQHIFRDDWIRHVQESFSNS